VENAGPTYQGLRHEPVSPAAGEPVTVSVDARDADGVARLAVLYRVNEGPLQTVEMTRASGDRFFGTIPGQAAGQQVQFYVRGTDALNAISHFPAAAEDSRAMYVVGERTLSTSGLHNLQIIMTGSDEQLLGARTNLMSNDRLGATVIYQDQVFYDVGIRLKGSEHGRPDPNRRGFSLEFAPDQLFRGVHSTVSIDRSGGWRFGRTFGQDEILIYHFFNRAGNVPSMYSDLIFVDGPTVPASTAILQMSRYNSVYLDSQYENGSDGTAYEYELIYAMQESSGPESLKAAQEGPSVVGIPVGTDLGDEAEFYRHYFLIKNNRAKDDYQPIMRLAKALSARSSEFDAATQEVMDVDQWMRAFAALSLSGANDNYNANAQHNAIFYERPSDGKMLLFPFDMDFAFILSPTAPLSSNTDLTRLLLNPTNRHAFLGHLHDIVSTSFNRDYMQSWVEHYDRLLPGQNLSSILGWIEQRAAHVLRQLPPQVSFVVAAEQQTASSPLAVIEGEGWVNVRQIRLAGSDTPLPVRWLDDRRWQATVPVSADSQTLELHAFDFGDNPIGSQTVVITRRLGDVSGDQAVNASDIDLLCAQIHSGDYDPRFDLYADGRIDLADQQVLIRDVLKTVEGDTNLDGIFNSSDLVAAFVRGGYEDDQPQNSGWASGDWNCDGEFNSRDFVVAFQRGGYVAAAIDTTTLGRARATAHGYVP
jgi:hypothetical protein